MMKKITLLLFLAFSMISCDYFLKDNPNKVFGVIGLNSNKIPKSFAQSFKEIRLQSQNGSLKIPKKEGNNYIMVPVKNFEEYMQYYYGKTFDKDIKAVEELKDNEEVTPMKKSAIEMFRYADEIYKKDFMELAKKLDAGATWDEIDSLVLELDKTKGIELDKKREALMSMVISYADKHGVKYKMIDTPF